MSRKKGTGTQTFENTIQQNFIKFGAVNRKLRPFVAGVPPASFPEDELAVAVVEAEFLRLHRDARQALLQAELGQLAHAVRQQVDAHAQRLDRGRRFEDLA